MARPVKRLTTRRRQNVAALLAVVALLFAADAAGAAALQRTSLLSGWLLLVLVVGLALLNVRKKLPFLPLGNAATWLQVHIYGGFLSGVLFGMHLRWRMPNGLFESVLALLFMVVFLSGVLGLVVSRLFARRLTTRGSEVLFGRIPPLRHHLRMQVERLVMQCMATTESSAISEFYFKHLKDYFDRPRHVWKHLVLSDRPLRQLLAELRWQERYLNDVEQDTMREIAIHLQRKDDLDYQYAHQVVLKYWLFAHIALTYALLVFAAVHAILAHAFSGAIR